MLEAPTADAMASMACRPPDSGARSTKNEPSWNSGASFWPTTSPTVVLPMPPVPVMVTQRSVPSRRR
ncbi:MAG: hypothetical protein WDN49_05785 [Acetobacteraceae bacterium]